MADNVNVPNTGSAPIRTIQRSGSVQTQVIQLDQGGEAGPESLVTGANPLATQLSSLNYPISTANSTNTQLAAGAQFVGAIETILNLQAAQVEIVCDVAYSVTINQWIDAGGTQLSNTVNFAVAAGVPFCQNITLPGNYFNLIVTNLSANASTALAVSTTFGVMNTLPLTLTALGNLRTAINEVGGVPVSGGALPVSIVAETPGWGSGGINTDDTNLAQAQSSDNPIFVAITGDPSGDFAGVNLLEQVINDNTGLAFNVRVLNPPKLDVNGATIISDAPQTLEVNLAVNTTSYVIDTAGYRCQSRKMWC